MSLPVAASMQTTRSPSVGVAGSARKIVYSFPRITIGVLRPPKSFRVHAKLLPSPPCGLIVSGSPVSRQMLLYSGPRQYVQSSGSALSAAAKLLAKILVQTSNALHAHKITSQKRFIGDSQLRQAGEVKAGISPVVTARRVENLGYATAPTDASCQT